MTRPQSELEPLGEASLAGHLAPSIYYLPPQHWDYRYVLPYQGFAHVFWELSQSVHIYGASALLAKASSQPIWGFIFLVWFLLSLRQGFSV